MSSILNILQIEFEGSIASYLLSYIALKQFY